MDASIAEIASCQHGLITRAQLLSLGLSSNAISNRITRGRLRVVHPAVYALGGSPPTWDQQLLAALLAAGDASAISHLAAGAFWQLDAVRASQPHIVLPHGQKVRLAGVHVHRSRTLEDADVTRRPPIRITTPARTLIDLAGLLCLDDLENALDDSLRRKIVTVKMLTVRLGRITGSVSGLGRLRRLVLERKPGRISGSPPETRFRRRLARSGMPAIPQYVIEDDTGRFVARVDFAYPDSRLAIEIDGWTHHSGRRRWESDLSRQNRLSLAGWHFLRFTRDQADHDPSVLKQIAAKLGDSYTR